MKFRFVKIESVRNGNIGQLHEGDRTAVASGANDTRNIELSSGLSSVKRLRNRIKLPK